MVSLLKPLNVLAMFSPWKLLQTVGPVFDLRALPQEQRKYDLLVVFIEFEYLY